MRAKVARGKGNDGSAVSVFAQGSDASDPVWGSNFWKMEI